MSTEKDRDEISAVLAAPLQVLGLDLEAVELTPAGKRRMLRVAVDKDGGVTLDDIAEATKDVARILDESDVMGEQPYTLEVTSPGVDRPLTLPRHWRRNVGRLVKVTLDGGETLTGRIQSTDESTATILGSEGVRDIRLESVKKARIEVEFNRKES